MTEPESGPRPPFKTAAIDALLIAITYYVSLLFTNPFGDFPLNDDWSFGLAVKRLIETGEFRPTGWTAMPLISQVLWGRLFCFINGFSFNALRLSTLTLSLFGVLATYFLLRELRQPRLLALVVTLTLAFSPVYYALSHTFMTDVPFTATIIIASLCFVRHLRSNSHRALVLGTSIAVAATLTRQLAISVPIAFAIALVLKKGLSGRTTLLAAFPSMLCVAALSFFRYWLVATGRSPTVYGNIEHEILHSLTRPETILVFAENAYVALLYLGIFLSPVLLCIIGSIPDTRRKTALKLLAFASRAMVLVPVTVAVVSGKYHLLRENYGDVIVRSGIGPLTLHDRFSFHGANLPTGFWIAAHVTALIGAALLLAVTGLGLIIAARRWRPGKLDGDEAAGAFLVLGAAIYLVPILTYCFYDRYLLPAIPLLAAGGAAISLPASRDVCRTLRVSSAALLCGLALYAVCGTSDYLAWNRLRWMALHDLVEVQHIAAEEIDGGFEFNGWHFYDPGYKSDPGKSPWWVQGDRYRIGFDGFPGYRVVKKYCYLRWLPPGLKSIVVLEKESVAASLSGPSEFYQVSCVPATH